MTDKELDHLLMKSKQVPMAGRWYDTVTGEGEPCVNTARPDEYHGMIICKNGQFSSNWIMNYIAEACNTTPEMIKEIKQLRKMVTWLAMYLRDHIDFSGDEIIEMARKASQNEA